MLGQVEIPTDVVNSATKHGWEAALLVTIVLAIVSSFAWVLRRILTDAEHRETRLAERVTKLEEQIKVEIFTQLRSNTEAMAKVIMAAEKMCAVAEKLIGTMDRLESTLSARPCLLASIEHGKILEHLSSIHEAKQT